MSIFYNNAKKVGYMDYIIMRELGLHGAKIILGFLLVFILAIFGEVKYIFYGIILLGVMVTLGLMSFKEE
jgi:hypothetical protein